jgi:hypothetical protein
MAWKRSISLFVAAMFALTALVQPAQGQTKVVDRGEVSFGFVERYSCDFPIRVRIEGKYSVKRFKGPNGRFARKLIETSPGMKVKITNLDTGESQSYSIAGPWILKIRRDTRSVIDAGVGPWVYPFHPGTNEEGRWVTRGRWVIEQDRNGDIITRRFTGRAIDVCAALS